MDTRDESKQAVRDLLAALNASQEAFARFLSRCDALGTEVLPIAKELARPTVPLIEATTAFYQVAASIIEACANRVALFTAAVHGTDLLTLVRARVDQSGAISVEDFESITAESVPGASPEGAGLN